MLQLIDFFFDFNNFTKMISLIRIYTCNIYNYVKLLPNILIYLLCYFYIACILLTKSKTLKLIQNV